MPNSRHNKERTVAKGSERNAKGMTNSGITMAVNEKVNYIYTCLNGLAIKEWINIDKAVIELMQVITKLWYEKIESTVS